MAAVAAPPMKGRKKKLVTRHDPKVSAEVARILVKFVDDFLEYSYSQVPPPPVAAALSCWAPDAASGCQEDRAHVT